MSVHMFWDLSLTENDDRQVAESDQLYRELKITQRNTNRTASDKSIFKIYILYEVIK